MDMFITEITMLDIERSSTLSNNDLGLYAVYCNGAIIKLCQSYESAVKTIEFLK